MTKDWVDHLEDAQNSDMSSADRMRVKIHVLDTLTAILSGSLLLPGRKAREYALSRMSQGSATAVGLPRPVSPELAALVNGIAAHSDETDDTAGPARLHPGASVVPAALAAAEVNGSSGADFLSAVGAGYHFGMTMNEALWPTPASRHHAAMSPPAIGQTFGAFAASAAIARLSGERLRVAMVYAVQMAAGISTAYRDGSHVEKAFVMGGAPAQNGVLAVEFVKLGFLGSEDALHGSPNAFEALGDGTGDARRLSALLARPARIHQASIKRYPVGMPIQAALQALAVLLADHPIDATRVTHISCRLPAQKAHLVDNRDNPAINVRYALAATLLDGETSFQAMHDTARLQDPRVVELMRKIEVIHDPGLDAMTDQESNLKAVLEIAMGTQRFRHTVSGDLLGSADRPMSWDDVCDKASDILEPMIGEDLTRRLIDVIESLESHEDIGGLSGLLTGVPSGVSEAIR